MSPRSSILCLTEWWSFAQQCFESNRALRESISRDTITVANMKDIHETFSVFFCSFLTVTKPKSVPQIAHRGTIPSGEKSHTESFAVSNRNLQLRLALSHIVPEAFMEGIRFLWKCSNERCT